MFGYGSNYLNVYFKLGRTVYKYALRMTSTKCSKQLMTLGIFFLKK